MARQPGPRTRWQVRLSASQRKQLKRTVRAHTAGQAAVLRARIVLQASAGLASEHIARRLGVRPATVRKWRRRWCQRGLAGLGDLPRPGRPRAFPHVVVAQVKALACELPAIHGVPLSRWSLWELRQEVIAAGLVEAVSQATLWRWLHADVLKPWQHHAWIFPRDPEFAAKAGVVLDLYQGVFDGVALQPGEFVISADEKTSIQVRRRRHASLPAGRARPMRVEHEYERQGALAYLAAWDVHQARLFGRCEPSTGIEPFGRLVAQVMTTEPYASARRVFWVVDNGSSHRGQAAVKRLEGRYHNLRLIHLPVHASWLNQIEIYFSVVQRKVLTPNDFQDLAGVRQQLLGFQHRYQQTAEPFDWQYTRTDLDRLLRRLDQHEQLTIAA
jgi:transposase